MIITCPSCRRRYRLEERLVKLPYQKVRCSLCGHLFVYERPPGKDDGLPMSPAGERKAPAGKRHRALTISAAVLVIAVILAGIAYFYWMNYAGASDRWLTLKNVEGQETVIKDGKVFFIRGIIRNSSTKTRKYAILKAKLFDAKGAVISEHFTLAGLALTSDDVREMTGEEIEKKVSDFRLSSLPTFVLQRNKELPFSIVFPDTYSSKPKEFTVEVIESPFQ